MPIKFEKNISWGNILTIITLIGGIIAMLYNNQQNVGEILTAHTIQLATNELKVTVVEKDIMEIKETLKRLESKVDALD